MCLTIRSSSTRVKRKACINNEQLSKDAAPRTLFPVVILRNVLFMSRPEYLQMTCQGKLVMHTISFPACPTEKRTIDYIYIPNEEKQSRKQAGLRFMKAEVSRVLVWRTTPQWLLAPKGYEDLSKN